MAAPKYLQTGSTGDPQEVAAAQTSAANSIVATGAAGTLDPSLLPETEVVTGVVSSENIAAGAFVNFWNNAGTINVRNADNSTIGKQAHGFVTAATTSGQSPTVYRTGTNAALSGLTAATEYFLGSTGGFTATLPSASGCIMQRLGIALSTTALYTAIRQPIVHA